MRIIIMNDDLIFYVKYLCIQNHEKYVKFYICISMFDLEEANGGRAVNRQSGLRKYCFRK